MDIASRASLLRETAEHHDPYETHASRNWWDWHAACMDARERVGARQARHRRPRVATWRKSSVFHAGGLDGVPANAAAAYGRCAAAITAAVSGSTSAAKVSRNALRSR